jgi:hypothetical protein
MNAPNILPTAFNSGTLGASANGLYEPGAMPGVPGVPASGFGTYNSACQFNGLAGYVYVPGTSLNFTGALTLQAWVRADPANGFFQTIAGKGDTSYRLNMDENGHPRFADGQQSSGDLVSVSRIDDGQWHQLAGVYDGTNSEYLYLDGQLAASTHSATIPVAGNIGDFWIGGAPDYPATRTFSGVVDEVAVFNTALSAAQLQQMYRSATNAISPVSVSPVLQPVTRNGSILTLRWSALAGRTYQVQFKTNLLQATWNNLAAPLTATNATAAAADSIGPDPRRFYRVVLLP